jgi:hypothetical protein
MYVSTGTFTVNGSSNTANTKYGVNVTIYGNWDGDGLDNIGVFRPSSGQWRLYTPRLTQVIVVYSQAGETLNGTSAVAGVGRAAPLSSPQVRVIYFTPFMGTDHCPLW